MRKASLLVCFGLVMIFGERLFAQTANSPSNPNNVSANVLKVCTVSAFTVDFGDYDASAATAKTQTGTPSFNVRCTVGTPYTVTLGNGSNFTTTRRMRLSATTNYLNYNLSHTPPAGGGTGTGAAQSYSVTGDIPVGQWVTPGAYTDTVVVTITY